MLREPCGLLVFALLARRRSVERCRLLPRANPPWAWEAALRRLCGELPFCAPFLERFPGR
ncbi:MAG: hypothetical protein D6731_19855 [Planctomycetota bacterium]|nr:MAG: hypothetical protein D6731_19855 [Planctomycetota bacterium]